MTPARQTVARRTRDADESRQRVWDAAAQAFAARGFDGAKVDDIAAQAGINKAMLYYHFADKVTLYREILRDMFAAVAKATTDVRAAGGTPESQLRRYVAAIARAASERPHFPSIWLREIADDGRHLDPSVFGEIKTILGNLGAMLADGRKAHGWRAVDPFLIQAGIVAPVMLVLATRRLRARAGVGARDSNELTPMVEHFTAMTLTTLTQPFDRTERKR